MPGSLPPPSGLLASDSVTRTSRDRTFAIFIFSREKYFSSENRARRGIFRVKKIFVRRPLGARFVVFRGEIAPRAFFCADETPPQSCHNVVHPKNDGKFSKPAFNLFDGLSGDSH
jgi:hypothetical protein